MIIRITVHAYAEEKLQDEILRPHSKHYGIEGKEIVSPLRKINHKEFVVADDMLDCSVAEFWEWLGKRIYGNDLDARLNEYFTCSRYYDLLEKYFVFHNLRYRIIDEDKTVRHYLDYMNADIPYVLDIQLLLCLDAGTVFRDHGIRFYMHSKEAGKHNEPHVHVDIRHEASGSFSIMDGRKLSGEGIKNKDVRRIQKMIEEKRDEFLLYWNTNTDGLCADLNQAFDFIKY